MKSGLSILCAGSIMAFFDNTNGNQNFTGTVAEYDQVNYQGSLTDYVFTLNANDTITVAHPTLGTDTLISMEGFWFNGERAWYSTADAFRLAGGDGGNTLVFDGTSAADVLIGNAQSNQFYGGAGNDVILGNGGALNTARFDGSLIEYTISRTINGDTLMSHPTWGEDTLTDIDRLSFIREGAEYTIQNALNITQNLPAFRVDTDVVINGTPNRDFMNGTGGSESFYGGTGNDIFNGGGGFDQVNFDGALSEYAVTQIPGGFVFEHPIWGIDVLRNIEGLWMSGEGVWYPVIAATFGL